MLEYNNSGDYCASNYDLDKAVKDLSIKIKEEKSKEDK